MKDLITTESLVPETLFASLENVEETVNRIRTAATSVVFDVSTRKGQEDTKSMAYKVSQTKSAGVKGFDAFLKEKKEEIKNYNSRKKTFVDSLDDLRDEIRKPVTEMEERENARKAAHEECLDKLTDWLSEFPITQDINDLFSLFDHFKALHDGREWEEYQDGADRIFAKGSDSYNTKKTQLDEAKRLAEENARLKKEAEELAQKERDERIAREAADAARREEERKREEADRKARAERDAEQRRLREAEEAKLQAQREAIELREKNLQSLLDAKEEVSEVRDQANLVITQATETIEQAENHVASANEAARIAEEKAAEAERKAKVAEEQAENAAQAERDRIAEEKRIGEEAAAAREADKAHRAKINNEAMQCLIDAGVSKTAAKQAVTAVAQGKVSHVTIRY